MMRQMTGERMISYHQELPNNHRSQKMITFYYLMMSEMS